MKYIYGYLEYLEFMMCTMKPFHQGLTSEERVEVFNVLSTTMTPTATMLQCVIPLQNTVCVSASHFFLSVLFNLVGGP